MDQNLDGNPSKSGVRQGWTHQMTMQNWQVERKKQYICIRWRSHEQDFISMGPHWSTITTSTPKYVSHFFIQRFTIFFKRWRYSKKNENFMDGERSLVNPSRNTFLTPPSINKTICNKWEYCSTTEFKKDNQLLLVCIFFIFVNCEFFNIFTGLTHFYKSRPKDRCVFDIDWHNSVRMIIVSDTTCLLDIERWIK